MNFFGRFFLLVAVFAWWMAFGAAAQGVVEYSHGEPTDYEQLMLELVNEARADPLAEAARLGIDLNEGLAAGRIGPEPKPPLAFHPQLIEAARNHSDWMLAADVFSHTGAGGSTPTQRAASVGYRFGVAENIAYYSHPLAIDFLEATRENHDGLFKSAGHRVNLMDSGYTLLGLGVRRGNFNGSDAQMVSQSFSSGGNSTDSGPFLLGVVYDDKNGNGFYDVGEGLPGVRVEPDFGGYYAVTSASGGYAVPLPPVETVSETVNLPFAVGDGSWEQARPYDEAFRREKIQSAGNMTLRIAWSGEAIGGATLSVETVKRPVRIDYRLMGTNNVFFPRTMVSAENVKVDFLLQDPPAIPNRVVRLAGNLGEFDIELFGLETPLTARNFLNYVESGRYDGSFIHRSVPGFVIQGGGFGLDGNTVVPVATDAAVPNEPGISNVRGTVAMAKLGNDPDSATSQWFINLADNSGAPANLDNQNGGFTVFGRVLGNGMALADRVAGLATYNASVQLGPPFSELPLLEPSLRTGNLILFQSVRALPEGTVVREFDFSGSDQGFAGGFADFPAGSDPALYELAADHRDLPTELGGGKGLFISGANRSDDLWMFWKKKLTGLRPNTVYEVAVDLEMASNVAAGLVGIGGAPGESVFVKAGASTVEPGVVVDSQGWVRSNVDKGNQSGSGVSASVLGNVAKENDASENYARLSRDNRASKRSVASGADGSLWIFFGTDSGFEGTTSLYYTRASVVLVPSNGLKIMWPTPAAMTAGEALGAGQLNATANVAGTFSYTPAAGTVLAAGNHTLGVLFTPSDSGNYTTASAQVSVLVNPASPPPSQIGGGAGTVEKPKKKGGKSKSGSLKKSGGSSKKSEAKKSGGKKSGGKKKKRG